MVDSAQNESLKKDAADTLARLVKALAVEPSKLVSKDQADKWRTPSIPGKFSDIVYPEQNAGTNIEPLQTHLDRVRQLASLAQLTTGSERKRYCDCAIDALVFYAQSDFKTKNWWQRQIGLAKRAARGLVLLAEADANGAKKLGTVVDHLQTTSSLEPKWTGANRSDIAYIQFLWAIGGWKAKGDDAYLDHALAASEAVSTLCMPVSLDSPAQGEGIRLDYSFSQHNPVRNGHVYSQLYAGGYGIELLNTVFEFMATLSGAFSLKWEAIFYIERFLENGIARFAYKGFCDFHVCGRRISRSTPGTWGRERWNRLLQNEYEGNQTDRDGHKGLNVMAAEKVLISLKIIQLELRQRRQLKPLPQRRLEQLPQRQLEQRQQRLLLNVNSKTLLGLKDLLDRADPEDLLGVSYVEGLLGGMRNLYRLYYEVPQPPLKDKTQYIIEKAKKQWFAHSVGNRAYWLNDYMTHFTPKFALFTKTVSTRTVSTETGNGENLKGYYMGCGSYFVVASGEEYKNIQPLWEWQQLPGTTVEQIPNFTYPLVEWGYGAWGSHDFSGVLSDGKCGIASMVLTKGNIKNARKSVVALKDSVICLGSAGDRSCAKHPVHTTVNQSRFEVKVDVRFKDDSTQSLESGKLTSKNISEVTHDGFRYRFLNVEQNVTIDITTRTGAWKDIGSGEPDAQVSGTVFSLWVDHTDESNDKYCYEISRSDDAQPQDVQIVLTDDAHIVTCPKLNQAIGSIFTGPSPEVQVGDLEMTLQSPLTFSAVSNIPDALELTVADLTQKLEETTVCVKLNGQTYTHIITLPNKGETRGKSVTVNAKFQKTQSGLELLWR